MPHEHVTVTLDADTVANIEADLEPGESVAARIRAIVEGTYGEGGDDSPGDDQSDYDPAVEFVDDCSV